MDAPEEFERLQRVWRSLTPEQQAQITELAEAQDKAIGVRSGISLKAILQTIVVKRTGER